MSNRIIRSVNIHAGHTPSTGKAPGAVGILNESVEDRKIAKMIIKLLRMDGCTVYNCTCAGNSQSDNLQRIVRKCNAHSVDIDASIHLNSGRNDHKGDGKTGGVEVLIKTAGGQKASIAGDICSRVSNLGYTNRGVKLRNDLYVLNHTKNPALLVECCFVDDKDDAMIYDYKKIARAIANGIAGHAIRKKPTLKINAKSSESDIMWMQQRLNSCITDKKYKKLAITGKWTHNTTQAVLLYWNQIGWNKDGKKKGKSIGKNTIEALYRYRMC